MADTLFPPAGAPADSDAVNGTAIEVGGRLTPDVSGTVQVLVVWMPIQNAAGVIGRLYNSLGEVLAEAEYESIVEGVRNTVTLDDPIALDAGETYTVSAYFPQRHFVVTPHYYTTDVVSGHLTGPADVEAGLRNGCFHEGGQGFPTDGFHENGFWVDVEFVANTTTDVSTSDSASIADTATVSASASIADSAAVADTATVAASSTTADTAVVADTATVTAGPAGADTATAADTATVTAQAVAGDALGLVDVAAVTAAVTGSEAWGLSETAAVVKLGPPGTVDLDIEVGAPTSGWVLGPPRSGWGIDGPRTTR